MGKIVVAGSLNMDLSVCVEHIPAGGETILGGDLLESPGGKGANQAYAAAKLAQGGSVIMLGCVGQDEFGREMLRNLGRVRCDVSHVESVPGASGVAFIVVSTEGENAIVVAPGANALFSPSMAENLSRMLDGADALLLQLEIPLETVKRLAQAARARGVRVILDPAPVPAAGLPDEILGLADILTPNETEAAALTAAGESSVSAEERGSQAVLGSSGAANAKVAPPPLLVPEPPRSALPAFIEEASRMAEQLARRLGAGETGAVVLKLGSRGCLVYQSAESTFIPAPKVNAVDTTAAGDVFNAGLAVGLSEGLGLPEACLFATRAAALSVTRKGAQWSAPSREEIREFSS